MTAASAAARLRTDLADLYQPHIERRAGGNIRFQPGAPSVEQYRHQQ
jgi:hypothetical protein